MTTLNLLVDYLADVMAEADPDTGELSEASLAKLDSLDSAIEGKLEAIAAVCRRMAADEAACKELAAHYAAKARSHSTIAARLKRYALEGMLRAGLTKSKSATATVWVQDSTRVEVAENWLATLPPKYVRQPPTPPPAPDKQAIKDALDAGDLVPGADLVREPGLRIR